VTQVIFHPEARAEMGEAFNFYEARLGGLGLRFLSAIEQTAERILPIRKRAFHSLANSANELFMVSPTV
jgi:hypothetical protein